MPGPGIDQWLISRAVPGAGTVRFRLIGRDVVHIGRSTSNDLVLPDPGVSRDHAVLEWRDDDAGSGHWRLSDQASSSGTYVNGVALQRFQSLRLEPGDRVDIGPIALEYIERDPDSGSSTIHTVHEDTAVDRVDAIEPAALTAQQLEAVLNASHQIHVSESDQAVHECVVNALVQATGFPDVAFVRPSPDSAEILVLASAGDAHKRRFSRTVLRRARQGPVVISDARSEGATLAGTLVGLDMARVICVPVEHNENFFGLVYLSDRGKAGANLGVLASLVQSVARVAALALGNLLRTRMSQRLEAEQRAMFNGTLQALIAAIDAKDPYTRGHSARVADYSVLLARACGLPPEECERARLCGMVHDIGKIGVSELILRKTEQLTEDEFRSIAAHPEIGHAILQGIPQMADLLPGVLEHHERYDGTGYPHGTKGRAISQLGRLVCIADSLDAMTTSRTYRQARPLADAIAEIQRCAGTQFDPEMATALARIDVRDLRGVVGAHVMGPTIHVAPPEAAHPFTEIKAG